jgi:glutaredoxin
MSKVIVYSIANCLYCDMVKEYLRHKRKPFICKDILIDKNAKIEMMKKTNQSRLPIIDIDGEIVAGFDKKAIDKALKH